MTHQHPVTQDKQKRQARLGKLFATFTCPVEQEVIHTRDPHCDIDQGRLIGSGLQL